MPVLAANIDFLFREAPKLERIGRAAAAGFRAVEVGCLSEDELSALRTAARDRTVDVIHVSLGAGDLLSGGVGYMGVPGQRLVVEREVRRALRHARALDCGRIGVPPSRVPRDLDRDACFEALVEHLAWAADVAAPEGIDVLIEPLNSIDCPGFLIASTDDALAAVRAAARENVGLQLDLYHAAMQGESLADSIHRAGPYLRHVQFADCPGRHEPGTGNLPLVKAFSLLDQCGYLGWAAAEYVPSVPTEQSLSWLGAWALPQA